MHLSIFWIDFKLNIFDTLSFQIEISLSGTSACAPGSFSHWLWISHFKIQLQIFSITSKLWPISFVIHPTQSCLYQIIRFNPFSKCRSNGRHNGWVISKAGAQQLLLGGLTAAWPSSQLWGGKMKWNEIICKGKRTSGVNDRGFCPAASIDHIDHWLLISL